MHVPRIATSATLTLTIFLHGCAPPATAPAPLFRGSDAQLLAPLAPLLPAPTAPPLSTPLPPEDPSPIAPPADPRLLPRTTAAGRIALDDERVYWIENHPRTSLDGIKLSRVLSAPRVGGPPVELAAAPTSMSAEIAVDDAYVYVGYIGKDVPNPDRCPPVSLCSKPATIHGPTGKVLAIPKLGGTPRLLASGARDPVGVVAAGGEVYWADGNQIFRVARTGGAPTLVFTGDKCRALALDATHVYCGGNGLSRIPRAGGTMEPLVPAGLYETALVVGSTSIYFHGTEVVRRTVPRPPDPSRGAGQGFTSPRDPWIDRIPRLTTVGKGGGAARTIVRTEWLKLLVVDAKNAYWVGGEGLFRAALAGGSPVIKTSLQIGYMADGLAVEGSQVYWIDSRGVLERASLE